ncbi:MAG TPA: hypothetical protein VD886_02295 [Herpetosiphonaceae bacterium]|nr:hypothetical protein [Herpetosiphonaceae bacterium]
MHSCLAHIDFNVRSAHVGFYKELFAFFGWRTLVDGDGIVSVGGSDGVTLCFLSDNLKDVSNDYDGPGMNHLAIGVGSPADVDQTAAYLRGRGIEPLFTTPRHRPEFAAGDGDTYYQVMFASPDNILFEVVYIGPKDAAHP